MKMEKTEWGERQVGGLADVSKTCFKELLGEKTIVPWHVKNVISLKSIKSIVRGWFGQEKIGSVCSSTVESLCRRKIGHSCRLTSKRSKKTWKNGGYRQKNGEMSQK